MREAFNTPAIVYGGNNKIGPLWSTMPGNASTSRFIIFDSDHTIGINDDGDLFTFDGVTCSTFYNNTNGVVLTQYQKSMLNKFINNSSSLNIISDQTLLNFVKKIAIDQGDTVDVNDVIKIAETRNTIVCIVELSNLGTVGLSKYITDISGSNQGNGCWYPIHYAGLEDKGSCLLVLQKDVVKSGTNALPNSKLEIR